MQLQTTAEKFKPSNDDLKQIYISFIRSIAEQPCVVWNNGLTKQNIDDLKRLQKSALKIILKGKYVSYEHALKVLNLEKLWERRNSLTLKFSKTCEKNEKI